MATLQVEKDLSLGVAVIWMDEPNEKFNKLTIDMAPQFTSIFNELEADSNIQGIVITSRKKDSFLAGADVNQFLTLKTAKEAEELSLKANEMYDFLAKCKKPTVAAIHGICLGGGTEMALACTARIASDSPKTYLALPEVKLGLLPGAGGSQRLPRLVGIQNALEMMLTGKNIYAKKAYKMGLVDAIVHPSGLLEAAKQLALEISKKPIVRVKKMPLMARMIEGCGLGRGLIYNGARKMVAKQSGENYPAPYKIIECVKIGMEKGLAKGKQAESEKFGELSVLPVTRQLINLFFNMTAHKKNPFPDLAKKTQKLGILGGGFMGCGIAQVSAPKEIDVLVKDIKVETLEQCQKTIYEDFNNQVKKYVMTAHDKDKALSRVFPQLDYHGFDKTDLVIEAVFENLNLKQKVLAETEKVIREDCVFASNTSCIPITEIAQNAAHPERVLGMHYFSPVPAMPLLEIIVTKKTADWALATAYELGMRQGKTIIVVNDGPGFYTTRILVLYMGEALTMLEQGADIVEIDKAMKKFGFPVGPIVLLDEVGIDVGAHIYKFMENFFASRGFSSNEPIQKLFAEGYYGRKNKKGFYIYPNEKKGKKHKKEINSEIYRFFGGSKRKSTKIDEIQTRLGLVMANEAAYCLQEGILRTADDGDIGAIMGLGYPPFLGGPFRYMDHLGIAKVVDTLKELEQKYGKKFTPAQILVDMAQKGERFYKE